MYPLSQSTTSLLPYLDNPELRIAMILEEQGLA